MFNRLLSVFTNTGVITSGKFNWTPGYSQDYDSGKDQYGYASNSSTLLCPIGSTWPGVTLNNYHIAGLWCWGYSGEYVCVSLELFDSNYDDSSSISVAPSSIRVINHTKNISIDLPGGFSGIPSVYQLHTVNNSNVENVSAIVTAFGECLADQTEQVWEIQVIGNWDKEIFPPDTEFTTLTVNYKVTDGSSRGCYVRYFPNGSISSRDWIDLHYIDLTNQGSFTVQVPLIEEGQDYSVDPVICIQIDWCRITDYSGIVPAIDNFEDYTVQKWFYVIAENPVITLEAENS